MHFMRKNVKVEILMDKEMIQDQDKKNKDCCFCWDKE